MADFSRYQDLLAALQLANATIYPQFIMVSTDTGEPGASDYYVGVPNQALLAGFERL